MQPIQTVHRKSMISCASAAWAVMKSNPALQTTELENYTCVTVVGIAMVGTLTLLVSCSIIGDTK